MSVETDLAWELERALSATLRASGCSLEDELRNIEAMRAIDLPHPATYAFGLWSQFPREAAVMVSAQPTPQGFKVLIRDPYDERLANLRRLGMLAVIGHQPTRESIARGWYITGYAEKVRGELVAFLQSRE